jgi:hypothetical protein
MFSTYLIGSGHEEMVPRQEFPAGPDGQSYQASSKSGDSGSSPASVASDRSHHAAGDGSSGVAGSRPCLGCEGTGCAEPQSVPHKYRAGECSRCSACDGTGRVTEPDSKERVRQALEDAETALITGIFWRAAVAGNTTIGYVGEGNSQMAYRAARGAAQSAFLLVPALKADTPPRRPEQPSLAVGLDRHRFGPGGMFVPALLLALFGLAGAASAADVSLLAGPLSSGGLGEQPLSGAVAVEAVSGPFEIALRYDSARKIESGAGWIGTASAAVAVGWARLGGAFVHRNGGAWSKDTLWLEPGAQAGPVTVTLRAAVAGQTEREYGARMRLDLHPRMGAEFQALRHHDGQVGVTALLFVRVGR